MPTSVPDLAQREALRWARQDRTPPLISVFLSGGLHRGVHRVSATGHESAPTPLNPHARTSFRACRSWGSWSAFTTSSCPSHACAILREGGDDDAFLLELLGCTDVRVVPASDRLHQAVVQQRLTLPDNEELRQHMANTIARHNRRGWRLDKPSLEQPNHR